MSRLLNNNNFDIVFAATIYLTEQEEYFSGGAEVHLRNMVDVVKSQKKVLVIQKSTGQDRSIVKDGVTVVFLHAQGEFRYKIRLALFIKQISAVQFHFNYIYLFNFVYRRPGVLYTATFHGTVWDYPVTHFPEPYVRNTLVTTCGAFIKKSLSIIDELWSLRRFDKTLSVDSSLLRFAQQFVSSRRNTVHVVPNFVDITRFTEGNTASMTPHNTFKILYPRNISFARGVHLLVPIAKQLRQEGVPFEILIVGGGIAEIGGNKYEALLHEEIEQNDLTAYFTFLGRVRHEDMPEMFRMCDVAIIPTFFSEGTSLSCLEAMASKKLVIATNIGGLNDLIIDGYNGLLTKPLAHEVAAALAHAYHNQEEMSQLVLHAHDMVTQVYSHDVWVKKVTAFFDL